LFSRESQVEKESRDEVEGNIEIRGKTKLIGLLVKPGTPEHGTPEQHHSGTRNTGTLKILNLLKIQKKNTGGCESIAAIIIA
jgi:polyisoprenoid-binding protein YceI